jgi:hypothetical protein
LSRVPFHGSGVNSVYSVSFIKFDHSNIYYLTKRFIISFFSPSRRCILWCQMEVSIPRLNRYERPVLPLHQSGSVFNACVLVISIKKRCYSAIILFLCFCLYILYSTRSLDCQPLNCFLYLTYWQRIRSSTSTRPSQ